MMLKGRSVHTRPCAFGPHFAIAAGQALASAKHYFSWTGSGRVLGFGRTRVYVARTWFELDQPVTR